MPSLKFYPRNSLCSFGFTLSLLMLWLSLNVNQPVAFFSLSLDVFGDSFDIIFDLAGIGSLGVQTVWTLSDLDWLATAGNIVGVTQISGPTVDNITFCIDSIAITVPDPNNTLLI